MYRKKFIKGNIRRLVRQILLTSLCALIAIIALASPALSDEPESNVDTMSDDLPVVPVNNAHIHMPTAPPTDVSEPPNESFKFAFDGASSSSPQLRRHVHNWTGKSSTNGWEFVGWYQAPSTACDTAHNTTVRNVLGVDVSKVKVSLHNICNNRGDLNGVFPEHSYWTQAGYHFCFWSHAYHYYTTHYWPSLNKHLEAYVISAEGSFGTGLPGGFNSCSVGDLGRAEVTSRIWVVAWPNNSWVGIWISRNINNF